MIERITDEELELYETLINPVAFAEIIFSDLANDMSLWEDDDKLSEIRLGQHPLLSYEYLLDDNPKLSDKQNFKLRMGAGTVYCVGGRKFGKTHITEKVDGLIGMVWLDNHKVGFSSADSMHVSAVLEALIHVLKRHPFFWEALGVQSKKSPKYTITLLNGYVMESINMNIRASNPGDNFFGYHLTHLYIEELSMETQKVYEKRIEAISDDGCIVRAAGMTDFTKFSPTGRLYDDQTRKPWVFNLPQYISPKWDAGEKKRAVKEHGGENSVTYRVFVKGEVASEGITVFDRDRLLKCYDDKKKVKHLEITKKTFKGFEHILIVERAKNAERVFIAADIGESAPTEITIFSEVNGVYRYLYNISLYNLTDKEQFKIFKYVADKVEANFIAIECGDGTGRSIYNSLEEVFPVEHLVWYAGNKKIAVGFKKDEHGNQIFDKDGKPVVKEEAMSEWSVKRLKDLFYSEKMYIPMDYKLDSQLNSVVATYSGNRVIYDCVSKEDHLFDSFRVFAIAEWSNEFNLLGSIKTKKFCKGGV